MYISTVYLENNKPLSLTHSIFFSIQTKSNAIRIKTFDVYCNYTLNKHLKIFGRIQTFGNDFITLFDKPINCLDYNNNNQSTHVGRLNSDIYISQYNI